MLKNPQAAFTVRTLYPVFGKNRQYLDKVKELIIPLPQGSRLVDFTYAKLNDQVYFFTVVSKDMTSTLFIHNSKSTNVVAEMVLSGDVSHLNAFYRKGTAFVVYYDGSHLITQKYQ
jgi:hypothetical protein